MRLAILSPASVQMREQARGGGGMAIEVITFDLWGTVLWPRDTEVKQQRRMALLLEIAGRGPGSVVHPGLMLAAWKASFVEAEEETRRTLLEMGPPRPLALALPPRLRRAAHVRPDRGWRGGASPCVRRALAAAPCATQVAALAAGRVRAAQQGWLCCPGTCWIGLDLMSVMDSDAPTPDQTESADPFTALDELRAALAQPVRRVPRGYLALNARLEAEGFHIEAGPGGANGLPGADCGAAADGRCVLLPVPLGYVLTADRRPRAGIRSATRAGSAG